ncbi:hypothetical protein HY990_01280 [Candidatus Micrarchaeota archaeon]|nr:hypothetical protein [Candidatus Micrarchaeota archaeon]
MNSGKEFKALDTPAKENENAREIAKTEMPMWVSSLKSKKSFKKSPMRIKKEEKGYK